MKENNPRVKPPAASLTIPASLRELLEIHHNIVFLGEAGSGKSELAVNLAGLLAEAHPGSEIHLFDMDQTKPLFRVRDIPAGDSKGNGAGFAEEDSTYSSARQTVRVQNRDPERNRGGFTIHYRKGIMDSPTDVGGVEGALLDPEVFALLDVGGGEAGARLIGQYAPLLGNALVLYLVNPYRPWSGNRGDLAVTMREVLGGAGLQQYEWVANPNLGPDTEPEDVVQGDRRIREELGIEPICTCVMEEFTDILQEQIAGEIFPMRIQLSTSVGDTLT